MAVNGKRLPIVDETNRAYEHPLYAQMLHAPGLSVGLGAIDQVLTWGLTNSLWIFPMGTSCCAIELMAAAASRVDLDRMGTIVRASPRQADVMVVAGTITVKMAPRVKKLWDQMPEPKWCIAMGSCAISGDFYRNLYSVVPGVDTFLPVDVYVPGCPPNPEGLMHGLLRLQDKVRLQRQGKMPPPDPRPELLSVTKPSVPRLTDKEYDPARAVDQIAAVLRATEAADARPSAAGPAPDATPIEALAPDADAEAVLRAHGVTDFPKNAPPLVPAGRHLALAAALRQRGYRQLVTIAASHWPAGRGRAGAVAAETEHFEIAYALRTIGKGSRTVTWSLRVEAGDTAPSLAGVLAGADWQEREQWDLVGVRFADHPDLRRIMMPEDWDGHPLRKDYPADKHQAPWR
jgi:NADH-quinone oxidoreductase subunit B/C/D